MFMDVLKRCTPVNDDAVRLGLYNAESTQKVVSKEVRQVVMDKVWQCFANRRSGGVSTFPNREKHQNKVRTI